MMTVKVADNKPHATADAISWDGKRRRVMTKQLQLMKTDRMMTMMIEEETLG